jgi:integrase/recombinase XerD
VPISHTESGERPRAESSDVVGLKTEYKALLQVAEQNRRDFAIVMLFLQTGLGVSELVDLRLGDVSLETKELTVRQGKGRKDQVVPLVGQALEALKGEY